MAAAPRPWARELLRIWFHELAPEDWFRRDAQVDALLRRRFAEPLAMLGARPAHEFLGDPQVALAAILLFDQIPRNLYRDTPRAFAFDPLALELSYGVIGTGWLDRFDPHERQFALMPLMHSEDIFAQQLSLHLFAHHARSAFSFARSHHRMIARFGRFPHRNAVLGRTSTAAEKHALDAGFSW